MQAVNLRLNEELQEFVDLQVQAGQFDGPASYVESLIRRAKDGKERLELLLIEGLDSGDPIPLDAEEWRRIRRDVKRRLADEC